MGVSSGSLQFLPPYFISSFLPRCKRAGSEVSFSSSPNIYCGVCGVCSIPSVPLDISYPLQRRRADRRAPRNVPLIGRVGTLPLRRRSLAEVDLQFLSYLIVRYPTRRSKYRGHRDTGEHHPSVPLEPQDLLRQNGHRRHGPRSRPSVPLYSRAREDCEFDR